MQDTTERDYWDESDLSVEQQMALDGIEEEVQELTIQANKRQFTEVGSH